ncbi:Os08g0202200, partial [Oryza sativa Japonica Group]
SPSAQTRRRPAAAELLNHGLDSGVSEPAGYGELAGPGRR